MKELASLITIFLFIWDMRIFHLYFGLETERRTEV